MSFYYETKATGTDEDATIGHYVYVKKSDEAKYWDQADDSFKDFSNLQNGKINLDELTHQPGLWKKDIDLATHTGEVTVVPRNTRNDQISGKVRRYYLIDGESGVAINQRKRALHENYGGLGNLRYIKDNGEPIEGAVIRVYTESQFDNNETDHPIGITLTDKYGEWINPVPVNTGDTYVVVFHKPKEYGPDNIKVTVSS